MKRRKRRLDTEKIYLITIYNEGGFRVSMQIESEHDLVSASLRGRAGAQFYGPGYTFKVWECKEVEPKLKYRGITDDKSKNEERENVGD
jgi:hypothetical protein